MNINEKTQFLFLISRCGEDEAYIFDSIDDMLDFWKIKTIKDLLKKYNTNFTSAHIYEINKEWSL